MGVLDDAIREHLELKRKHGVPEEELRRQEEEALGPVRREVAPPEEAEASGDGETPAEAAAESADEEIAAPAAGPDLSPFDGKAPSEHSEVHVDEPEPAPFAEEAAPAVPDPAEPLEPLPDPEEPEQAAEPAPDWFETGPEPSSDHPREESGRLEREPYPAEDRPRSDTPAAEENESAAPEDSEEEPKKAADVLEDTPDFLEETPEHDRLWFEQKPPRDFDFD